MIKVELEIKLNKKLFPVLFFSVIILSSILALGINLGFADMPWANVDAPINVSEKEQTKEGRIDVNEIGQKDWLNATNATWALSAPTADIPRAWFKNLYTPTTLHGNDIYTYNRLWTKGDLMVDGHIHAPEQGWADTKEAIRIEGDGTTVRCLNGWYLFSVYYHKSGNVVGTCGSPFRTYTPPSPPGPAPTCFTGKTPILMADATYKNIADVQPGEYILTRESENSSKLIPAKVLSTYEHRANKYLVINNSLEVTPEHKMFVNGKWKLAEDIKIGDKLLNKDNQEVVVESMEQITKELEFQVYNLEIEKYQTYFAGGFYVHNIKDDPFAI